MSRKTLQMPKINTGDFKRFPNARAFLRDFTMGHTPFYQRHLQLLSQMHGEICGFCSNAETVENMRDLPESVIDTDVAFLEHGVCLRCRKTRMQNLMAGHWKAPNRIVISAGQRSGKGYFAALASLYAEHLMLTAGISWFEFPPAQAYGLNLKSDDVKLYMRNSFVSVSKQSAIYAFKTAVELRKCSAWFKAYREMLDEQSKTHNFDFVVETGTSLTYRHTQMITIAEDADAYSLRGPTRYFAVSDDITWCTMNEKPSGSAVHTSVENSLKTLRNASDKQLVEAVGFSELMRYGFAPPVQPTPMGLHLLVTTRANRADLFTELKTKSFLDSRVFVREYAVWEFSQLYTRKDFDSEFDKDFERANRDFAVYKLG